jgi:hypothetical protein
MVWGTIGRLAGNVFRLSPTVSSNLNVLGLRHWPFAWDMECTWQALSRAAESQKCGFMR